MRQIEIALKTRLSSLATDVMMGNKIGVTTFVFTEDGYRLMSSPGQSALVVTQAYLHKHPTKAYGLICEAGFTEGADGADGCLLMAVVTPEGNAKVLLTRFKRQADGLIEMFDHEPCIIDEPFLRLYDKQDTSAYDEQALAEAVEALYESILQPYSDFIVAAS